MYQNLFGPRHSLWLHTWIIEIYLECLVSKAQLKYSPLFIPSILFQKLQLQGLLGVYILCTFMLPIIVNLIQELWNVSLSGILLQKKDTNATIHQPKKFVVSMDVTFVEKQSYFSHPSLQGKKPSMEDKDSWLLELNSNHFPFSWNTVQSSQNYLWSVQTQICPIQLRWPHINPIQICLTQPKKLSQSLHQLDRCPLW